MNSIESIPNKNKIDSEDNTKNADQFKRIGSRHLQSCFYVCEEHILPIGTEDATGRMADNHQVLEEQIILRPSRQKPSVYICLWHVSLPALCGHFL